MNPTPTTNECDRNIEELRAWIAAHTPRTDWLPGQRQAYQDRLTSLAGWLAKSQLIAGGKQ